MTLFFSLNTHYSSVGNLFECRARWCQQRGFSTERVFADNISDLAWISSFSFRSAFRGKLRMLVVFVRSSVEKALYVISVYISVTLCHVACVSIYEKILWRKVRLLSAVKYRNSIAIYSFPFRGQALFIWTGNSLTSRFFLARILANTRNDFFLKSETKLLCT